MKMPPVGAELFLLDGQTDIKELIVVLRNFANAPKNNSVPENGSFHDPW
jgi:hypothetical protein